MCYTYYMPKKKCPTLKSLVNHILTKRTTVYCIHENSRKLYLSYCHVVNMIKELYFNTRIYFSYYYNFLYYLVII